MSDSDWSDNSQSYLRHWLFRALVAATAVIAVIGIQNWADYRNASSRAANDARNTENQIAAECVAGRAYAECSREIEQASRAEQRDEYDLYSQKTMALWTSVMGSMAVLGVALSGIGVYLIWGTWRQTAEANKLLRQQLQDARSLLGADLFLGQAHAGISDLADGAHRKNLSVQIRNEGSSRAKFISIRDPKFFPVDGKALPLGPQEPLFIHLAGHPASGNIFFALPEDLSPDDPDFAPDTVAKFTCDLVYTDHFGKQQEIIGIQRFGKWMRNEADGHTNASCSMNLNAPPAQNTTNDDNRHQQGG